MASDVTDNLPFINALGESLLSEAGTGKHVESKARPPAVPDSPRLDIAPWAGKATQRPARARERGQSARI
jgi:hypothetical protein